MASLAGEIRSYQDETFQSEFSQRKVERLQVFLLAGAFSLVLARAGDRPPVTLVPKTTNVGSREGGTCLTEGS